MTATAVSATGTIRLMLVDDHPVLRAGLSNLLGLEADITVVAQAGSGEAAIRLCGECQPNVCLLDLSMPGLTGMETLGRLREAVPDCRIVVLTSSESAAEATRALSAGAAGFVTKTVPYPEIVQSIRDVHAGAVGIRRGVPTPPVGSRTAGLSPREVEVLHLLRKGLSNPAIGKALGVTERTVKWHVAGILEKLGARDRTEAVARAFDLGLLQADPPRRP